MISSIPLIKGYWTLFSAAGHPKRNLSRAGYAHTLNPKPGVIYLAVLLAHTNATAALHGGSLYVGSELGSRFALKVQFPLIRHYTLNHIKDPQYASRYIP